MPNPAQQAAEPGDLWARAAELATRLKTVPQRRSSTFFARRVAALHALEPLLAEFDSIPADGRISDDYRWVHENARLLQTALQQVATIPGVLDDKPQVRVAGDETIPRVLAVAEGFLAASQYRFDAESYASYLDSFQEITPLEVQELWSSLPCLRLALLGELAVRIPRLAADPENSYGVGICIRSLHEIAQASWTRLIEPLILVDRVLREDPAGAYAMMDFDSRERYWKAVANIARHSAKSEMDVALEALSLARDAARLKYDDARIAARRSHVGYYLVAEGVPLLHQKTGFRPPLRQRLQRFVRHHANTYYPTGIHALTLAIVAALLWGVSSFSNESVMSSPWMLVLAVIALWLPCSQVAVELMNYITTRLLPAQLLPKLDFSEGIPDDCVSMVVVPALLLNEAQVCRLVEDLEVRFLGNRDPNLHFALLTDLADSKEPAPEDDPLVDLCAQLIAKLNDKYASQGRGSFLLLHRHRVHNPREGVWMGWERKRGKLLDLNKLLRQEYDSFPVKIGDLNLLRRVRFVITLDSDTELPRESAHRMVGALAHPLNQAVIDPARDIVVAGYGILQPRVGVSVHSAARSRLASIYSGQTGLDVYTRAVSDVYQDLFGEAIFTGKGIYEVDAMLRVLEGRFPQNALLSHDLIEGAYARAGLASDIEVIDDYPSRYSAHSRRKHRWVRGDWQVAEWLLPRVPDESGRRVANPISPISRWKIFDNLRRSLVETGTLLLLMLGWLVLPGSPLLWTAAALLLLFAPAAMPFGFALVRALTQWKSSVARDGVNAFFSAGSDAVLRLTFLAHQTLLSLDAIVRVLIRRFLTHRRLLEWETAAEAELGHRRRNLVDWYLDWTPLLAAAAALLVLTDGLSARLAAAPILLLWAGSKFIALWLNQPPRASRYQMPEQDRMLLRRSALATWRYFAEFSNPEHNWLIPDNVQEQPASLGARTSPTNLGLLLNARQVACELGYLTVPEFTGLSSRTLATMEKLPKFRGHLFNWYDTRSGAPMTPRFVSSADSGNLVASLWSLQEGCLERLRRPLLEPTLLAGFVDCLLALDGEGTVSRRVAKLLKRNGGKDWLHYLLDIAAAFPSGVPAAGSGANGADRWFAGEACARRENVMDTVRSYCPWLLPEFASLRHGPLAGLKGAGEALSLQRMPAFIESLENRLQAAAAAAPSTQQADAARLRAMLPEARRNTEQLIAELEDIAARAGQMAHDMDFRFLLHRGRKLLSVGYDVENQQLHGACYDLLASEARLAVFVAIAKGEIPQETWFMLGRPHTLDGGRPVLLSWTGTMFEYQMPALWMRTYPNTLLDRARSEAVRSQQAYAAHKRIPWGISESAYFKFDDAGNYQYHAFGLPPLALHKHEMEALVVSPYSTMLALHVDPAGALRNLRRMAKDGWLASYGFYEAADYTPALRSGRKHPYELVRCWMAHHQGMSLLAIANVFHDSTVQRWFHNNPRVQATELLLQEKPVSHLQPQLQRGTAAA